MPKVDPAQETTCLSSVNIRIVELLGNLNLKNRRQIAYLLLESTALIDIDLIEKNAAQLNQVDSAADEKESEFTYTEGLLFLFYAKMGSLEEIQARLSQNSNLIRAVYYRKHFTALHLAALWGHLNMVRYLVDEKEVLLLEECSDGFTALYYAVFYGRLEVVRYLIDEKGMDPLQKTKLGHSVLHLAAGCGHLNMLHYLLDEKEINPFEESSYGDTALDFAVSCDKQDCAQLLFEAQVRKRIDEGRDWNEILLWVGEYLCLDIMSDELNLLLTQSFFSILRETAFSDFKAKSYERLDSMFVHLRAPEPDEENNIADALRFELASLIFTRREVARVSDEKPCSEEDVPLDEGENSPLLTPLQERVICAYEFVCDNSLEEAKGLLSCFNDILSGKSVLGFERSTRWTDAVYLRFCDYYGRERPNPFPGEFWRNLLVKRCQQPVSPSSSLAHGAGIFGSDSGAAASPPVSSSL